MERFTFQSQRCATDLLGYHEDWSTVRISQPVRMRHIRVTLLLAPGVTSNAQVHHQGEWDYTSEFKLSDFDLPENTGHELILPHCFDFAPEDAHKECAVFSLRYRDAFRNCPAFDFEGCPRRSLISLHRDHSAKAFDFTPDFGVPPRSTD